MDKKFTWVKTHKDIVEWLKDKQSKQQEIIELLKQAGVNVKVDRLTKDGDFFEVEEIDPFTFFTQIYKHGEKSLKIIQQIAQTLNVNIPQDVAGIPYIYPLGAWLFPFKYERKDEVNRLWDFFLKAIDNQLTDRDFEKILTIKNIAKTRLTEVLFLIRPDKYLPINSPVIKYLNEVLDINTDFKTYTEYLQILKQVKQKDARPLYEISNYAHHYRVFAEVKELFDPKVFENFIKLLRKLFKDLKITKGDPKVDLIASKREKKFYCKIGKIYCLSAYTGSKSYFYGAIATENFSEYPPDKFEKYGFYNLVKTTKPIEQNWDKVLAAARNLYDKVNPTKHDDNHNPYFEDFIFEQFPNSQIQTSMNTQINYPLNLILYGPPGTGKTYNTVKIAAEIIEKRRINDYNEARRIFSEHLGERIRFITFHQSYSYQDFVQGIRPNVDNTNSLTFRQEDGIFMQIAIDALFEFYKQAKRKKQTQGKPDPEEVYLDFIEYLKTNNITEFETKTGKKAKLIEITRQNNIKLKPQEGYREYIVSPQKLLKLFETYDNISKIKNEDIRKVVGVANATFYWTILKEFIEFYENYSTEIDEEENLEDLDILSKKQLLANADLDELRKISPDQVPNYVLIIDEINRANISNVFGELITLLEPDKRSHGENPLIATLPSSGDQLVVPSNLYIIGTMNTADKSIALLDVALRRRFVFRAMYPRYDLPEMNDVEVLQRINQIIVREKGKDFQIGHSYFLTKDGHYDFVQTMNEKVIPLLLEYFMNDENKVREILQDALKDKDGYSLTANEWEPLQIKKL